MDFRLKLIQVGKFSISWSLTKLLDFGIHALPSLSGPTLPLAQTKTDGLIPIDLRENRNPLFVFLSLSLLFVSSPFFFSSFFLSFLSTKFLLFAHLLISFSFSFFSFFFHFLFSLFDSPTRMDQKVGETSPPLSSLATCHLHNFFLIFLIFFFSFYFPPLTHGSM